MLFSLQTMSNDGNSSNSAAAVAATALDRMADTVKRTEHERDNLQDQLTLIFEQTKTQREKIHELQDLLLEKAMQLESTEDLLREVSDGVRMKKRGCSLINSKNKTAY